MAASKSANQHWKISVNNCNVQLVLSHLAYWNIFFTNSCNIGDPEHELQQLSEGPQPISGGGRRHHQFSGQLLLREFTAKLPASSPSAHDDKSETAGLLGRCPGGLVCRRGGSSSFAMWPPRVRSSATSPLHWTSSNSRRWYTWSSLHTRSCHTTS